MKRITLAPQSMCTACGACTQVCPQYCIQMLPNNTGGIYPVINEKLCKQCGNCMKVCPALQDTDEKYTPQQVYAAWNTDKQVRMQAASGGIVSAIYEYALQNGYKTFGVKYTVRQKAAYIPICTQEDMAACRNSKYVFSDISGILKDIKAYLQQGETVILPALPCQVAAVLRFLGGRHHRLILIDIVCHGVCPVEYLNQHITYIQRKRQADRLYFRDPAYGTHKYVLSLYEQEKLICRQSVHGTDVYQLGYHKALNYRENCYQCRYATPNRLGDLTVADFSGLGRLEPFDESRQSVSCVMVSSNTGAKLLEDLQHADMVVCRPRPMAEALDYEHQLKAPSVPHKNRQVFIDAYQKNGRYDIAARKALKKDIAINCVKKILHVEQAKRLAARTLPKRIKEFIKKYR